MTEREKLAHLLRRFGLGASPAEMEQAEKKGMHGTIDRLLNYEGVDEEFPVSPWEFMFRPENKLDLQAYNITNYWALRLALTKRPLQEKLAVFWHDHFAVSGSKVENGPMLVRYVDMLRKHANGNFRTLLGAVTKDPAMLRWLDGDVSIKGKPNENYAREVLELFTLGIGNYTEKDIRELARAFTGWGLRPVIRGGREMETRRQIVECMEMDRPVVASSYSEELHDDGPKTILGRTASFDTNSALDHIVSRPATAKYVTGKLWSFFAYPNPEPKVVERLAKVFVDKGYEIKPVLYAIATSKEFWSDKCVRRQVKSPMDFVVASVRQLGIPELVMAQRKPGVPPTEPIQGQLAQVANLVAGVMRRQGMRLLYPPDVAGWDWGEAWVAPAMMMDRMRFADVLTGQGRGGAAVNVLRDRIIAAKPEDSGQAVDALLSVLDAPNIPERRALLIQALDRAGGVASIEQQRTAPQTIRALAKLVFSMPEYQMC